MKYLSWNFEATRKTFSFSRSTNDGTISLIKMFFLRSVSNFFSLYIRRSKTKDRGRWFRLEILHNVAGNCGHCTIPEIPGVSSIAKEFKIDKYYLTLHNLPMFPWIWCSLKWIRKKSRISPIAFAFPEMLLSFWKCLGYSRISLNA